MSSPLTQELINFQFDANCRHIPAFALGCVFILAFRCLINSSFIPQLFSSPPRQYDESIAEKYDSPDTETTSTALIRRDNKTLIFILAFCFASASITYFASLPAFPAGGKVACAFVIAWGGFASQSGRLVGVLILNLELRRLGIPRWEFFSLVIALVLATATMFANNAINTGQLGNNDFSEQLGSLCSRKHIPTPSAISSIAFALVEAYAVFRLWSLLAPPFLDTRRRLASLRDVSILRGLSLFLLEGLVAVPGAINTGIIGEYIPFSIGAIIVIGAFSLTVHRQEDITPTSIPATTRPPTAMTAGDGWTEQRQRSSFRTSFRMSRWSNRRDVLPTTIVPTEGTPQLHRHPFAAQSLNGSDRDRPQSQEWQAPPTTARSSRITIDSMSTGSIKHAVVQTAKRTHPFGKEPPLPALPGQAGEASPQAFLMSNGFLSLSPEQTTSVASHSPPTGMARPRLMLLTNPSSSTMAAAEYHRVEPDSALFPQTAISSSPGGVRLTPTFTPTPVSRFSVSTITTSAPTDLSTIKSTPSSRSNSSSDHSGASSQNSHVSTVPMPPTKRGTFGVGPRYFKAAGYINPIQTRISITVDKPLERPMSQFADARPLSHTTDSLSPLGEDWPKPPFT